MLRRCILSILIFISVFAFLAGCARMLEGEYTIQTTHSEQSDEEESAYAVSTASDYEELVELILSFAAEGQEKGVIRVKNYEGDAIEDMQKACMEIKLESPLGAYAVDYITYESNRILSYYEMSISITYRRSKVQIDGIKTVLSVKQMEEEISNVLRASGDYLAVSISSDEVTETFITEWLTDYYHENPLILTFLPKLTVSIYPGNTYEKIIEMEFEYPYSAYSIERMRLGMYDDASVILGGIMGVSGEKALEICLALAGQVEYQDAPAQYESKWSHENTAYGAISEGTAAAEGYAMAFKLLCDMADIECTVVTGRLDGVAHAWNIIEIDKEYYHVDPAMCDYEGVETAFLKRDEDMWGRYWWDTEKYEACTGGLTYWDIIGEDVMAIDENPDIQEEPEDLSD